MNRLSNPWAAQILNDAWTEHVRLSTGKIIKPFKDRHLFNHFSIKNGFQSQKPKIFIEIDLQIKKIIYFEFANNIIQYADNRMKMGDLRYGFIINNSFQNYNLIKEFWKRYNIAKNTENLEYVIDAYNMYRLQCHKTNKEHLFIFFKLLLLLKLALKNKWELISIDDGKHAEEQ